MTHPTVTGPEFDRAISLRDAYRVMERFATDYLARGDTSMADFLHAYAGEVTGGQTTDPAAARDFLAAAAAVLGPTGSLDDRAGA